MFDRFSNQDRVVIAFAAQEAKDLGHQGIGTDHLILGMLGNARSPLFAVLTEQGLTLSAARERVAQFHTEHGETIADTDNEATAADRYEADRAALASIGIDLDKVRAAVGERFSEDLADTWGERVRRGPRGGRGHHHGHGRGRSDCEPGSGGGPWEGRRGRRGPRGFGGRPRMGASVRDAMRAAVTLTRERGDATLRAEHVLLGILEVGDPASVALIESATTVGALRDAVFSTLPQESAKA